MSLIVNSRKKHAAKFKCFTVLSESGISLCCVQGNASYYWLNLYHLKCIHDACIYLTLPFLPLIVTLDIISKNQTQETIIVSALPGWREAFSYKPVCIQLTNIKVYNAGKHGEKSWEYGQNCHQKCVFFNQFSDFFTRKRHKYLSYYDNFPLKMAKISPQKQNFPGMRFQYSTICTGMTVPWHCYHGYQQNPSPVRKDNWQEFSTYYCINWVKQIQGLSACTEGLTGYFVSDTLG